MKNVSWHLFVYRRSDEELHREERLVGVDAATLRKLWNQPQDNPMFGGYPVEDAKLAQDISRYLDSPLELNLDRFIYLVEAVADD